MRKRDVSMPDEAEGQRLNLSSVKLTDMSSLRLGRMNVTRCTLCVFSCLEASEDRREACCS